MEYPHKRWARAAFLAVVICGVSAGYGGASPFCVEEYYSHPAEEQQSVLSDRVQALVDEIRQKLAMSRSVKVISCGQARKAVAVDRGLTTAPRGNYIVFDPIWVTEVIGEEQNDPVKKTEAVALFGHELGHFINGHSTEQPQRPLREIEAEADHTAGCAVARMGRSWRGLRNLLSRIRQRKDEYYPDRLTSLSAAKQGFVLCGGTPDAVEQLLGDNLQFGIGDEIPSSQKLDEINRRSYVFSKIKEIDGSVPQNSVEIYSIVYEVDGSRRVTSVIVYFAPEYLNGDIFKSGRVVSFSSYSGYFTHMAKFISACDSRLKDVASSIGKNIGGRLEASPIRASSSDFVNYKHLGTPYYSVRHGEYLISGTFSLHEVTSLEPSDKSHIFLDNWFYDNENMIVLQRAYCHPVFSIKISK